MESPSNQNKQENENKTQNFIKNQISYLNVNSGFNPDGQAKNNVFIQKRNRDNLNGQKVKKLDINGDLNNKMGDQKDSSMSNKNMGCNCKNSGCLKRYCECFSRMKYCDTNCQSKNCLNNIKNEKERNYDNKDLSNKLTRIF